MLRVSLIIFVCDCVSVHRFLPVHVTFAMQFMNAYLDGKYALSYEMILFDFETVQFH